MIEIILGSCLIVSITTIIIMAAKKTPIMSVIKINDALRVEVESLKAKLESSENRRKNILSINKGERALIPSYPLTYNEGTKDEKSFKASYEVDVIEVTSKKIKVAPYSVITNDNDINANQQRLQGIMDFLKDKWG